MIIPVAGITSSVPTLPTGAFGWSVNWIAHAPNPVARSVSQSTLRAMGPRFHAFGSHAPHAPAEWMRSSTTGVPGVVEVNVWIVRPEPAV